MCFQIGFNQGVGPNYRKRGLDTFLSEKLDHRVAAIDHHLVLEHFGELREYR